jgi:hypothetical protein
MDRDAFDGLTKLLASSPSRRAALIALAAALVPVGRTARAQVACRGPWQVVLPNGTCGEPCESGFGCETLYCGDCRAAIEGGRYCMAGVTDTPCTATVQCPAGSFCGTDGFYHFCTVACG